MVQYAIYFGLFILVCSTVFSLMLCIYTVYIVRAHGVVKLKKPVRAVCFKLSEYVSSFEKTLLVPSDLERIFTFQLMVLKSSMDGWLRLGLKNHANKSSFESNFRIIKIKVFSLSLKGSKLFITFNSINWQIV